MTNRLGALLANQTAIAAAVAGVLLVLGAVLYPSLPAQMAIHWNAAGEADNAVAKPVAILAMPAIVVLMRGLFAVSDLDADDRVVGSVAMLVLLVVQIMVFAVNLGLDVPIVPVSLALCLGLAALAVWFEVR